MISNVRQRLDQLRLEAEKGKARLAAIDQERNQLIESILRISGAIQVLEELIVEAQVPTVS